MRVVVQRVARASVSIGDDVVAQIGPGLLVLAGIETGDRESDVDIAVDKIANLRVFGDETGRMNRSLGDEAVDGEVLLVSQFTLLGDLTRGRRPSFVAAAAPDIAAGLLDHMVERLRSTGVSTSTGVFGASMQVELVNDGPVTLVFDVRNAKLR